MEAAAGPGPVASTVPPTILVLATTPGQAAAAGAAKGMFTGLVLGIIWGCYEEKKFVLRNCVKVCRLAEVKARTGQGHGEPSTKQREPILCPTPLPPFPSPSVRTLALPPPRQFPEQSRGTLRPPCVCRSTT